VKGRSAARHALDAKIAAFDAMESYPPPKGWVRAIRDALGMSTRDLADRMEIAQPSVVALEASERAGTIRLETLERAAAAMGCELVYALRPRDSGQLEQLVRERAGDVALRDFAPVTHTMALEGQPVRFTEVAALQKDIDALIDSPRLWRNEI